MCCQQCSRLARLLVVLAAPGPACAWISISQARFGADPQAIAQSMRGIVAPGTSAQNLLGYLWSLPADPLSDHGLGGGITYAWDPELCAQLEPLFREDLIVGNFVGCADFRNAIDRAFYTWASHHKYIHFRDVTRACEDLGHNASSSAMKACPLHEVFITAIAKGATADGAGPTAGMAAAGEEAATAVPIEQLTSAFRFTNGMTPHTLDGTSQVPRPMIETYRGEIRISTDVCWYLDSYFCAAFHALKQTSSPKQIHLLFTVLIFTMWSLAMLTVVLQLAITLLKQVRMSGGGEFDLDKDGTISLAERAHACADAFAQQTVMGTALRLVLIVIPWPFYQALFGTCWDCFDFEGAMTHEVGHLLGLGHPNLAGTGSELMPGFGTSSQNVYTAFFAQPAGGLPSNRYLNASTSRTLWDTVTAGLPPGAVTNKMTGQRQSIMDSFTAHNPHVCLSQDDLEGLNTLYPVDSGAIVEPRCLKSPLYIGFIRMVVYVVGPVTFALLLSILLHSCLHSTEQRKLRDARKQVAKSKFSAALFRQKLNKSQQPPPNQQATRTQSAGTEMYETVM